MNRPVKEATIKAFDYPDLDSLKAQVLAFVLAYNFAKHLKALRWKIPFDAVFQAWATTPAARQTGHLDAKTRELIAAAVAITLRCDGCITVHTHNARKLGATQDEIAPGSPWPGPFAAFVGPAIQSLPTPWLRMARRRLSPLSAPRRLPGIAGRNTLKVPLTAFPRAPRHLEHRDRHRDRHRGL